MELIDITLFILIIILIFVYLKQCKNKEHFVINNYNRLKRKQKNVKSNDNTNYKYAKYSKHDNLLYNQNDYNIELENEKEIKKCCEQNNIDFIQKNKNNLVEFTNGKNQLGPVKNFHQCFNNDNFKSNELGWRNWWIKNKTKHNIKVIKNTNKFMNNYLDNLEHLKNIYL